MYLLHKILLECAHRFQSKLLGMFSINLQTNGARPKGKSARLLANTKEITSCIIAGSFIGSKGK